MFDFDFYWNESEDLVEPDTVDWDVEWLSEFEAESAGMDLEAWGRFDGQD